MVDFKLTTPISPMLFSSDGYRVVVMPMMTTEAKEAVKEAKKAETTKPAEVQEGKLIEAKPTEVKTEKPKKVKPSQKVPVTA
jgi:hypothetical protein